MKDDCVRLVLGGEGTLEVCGCDLEEARRDKPSMRY
jgi:hypothetical protein